MSTSNTQVETIDCQATYLYRCARGRQCPSVRSCAVLLQPGQSDKRSFALPAPVASRVRRIGSVMIENQTTPLVKKS